MKTSKEYAEILKSILKMRIIWLKSDDNYESSEYLQGEVQGLYDAIEKIEASSFLTEGND